MNARESGDGTIDAGPVDAAAGAAGLLGVGPVTLALDVGGTDTKSALIDGGGSLLDIRRTPTPVSTDGTADALIAHLARIRSGYAARHPSLVPGSVGVSVPGLVDDVAGIGLFSSNLGWRDAPIRALAENAFGLPVAFGHDVRAAGDAEHRIGAARGYGDVIVLAIGTGVAGAIILNGHPYPGGGYAGEFGHSVIDPEGETCACGARGCLETISSAGAIVRRYRRAGSADAAGARDVLRNARAGDAVATRVWDEAVDGLATAVTQLAASLAPEAVVIGGGLSQAGDALFAPLRERVDARLSFHRRPEILPAHLGDEAGLLGTALAARDLIAGTSR